MSMALDAADLKVIADKLLALEAVEGVTVTTIEIDNGIAHQIYLRKDNGKYLVTGITNKVKQDHVTYRESFK